MEINVNKKVLFSVASLLSLIAAALPISAAKAQEVGSLAYYDLKPEERSQHRVQWAHFLEYNGHREPCQNYVKPPVGFYMKGCNLYRVEAPQPMAQQAMAETTTTTTTVIGPEPHKLLPIVSSYPIYFDFDKSNIRSSETSTLDKVANEISVHHPIQVTVAGHTDTSGSAQYNDALSQRRAAAVAQALTSKGIQNEIINKAAYGESDLAVPTPNGVKLEQNRRVVIDFRSDR